MNPMRGEVSQTTKGRTAPPWLWTLLASTALAALVACAGTVLSRQQERHSERPPGNRVDDAFHEMARRIDELETLWERALDAEAIRLLDEGLQMPRDGTVITGISQRSLLNVGLSDPVRQHLSADGKSLGWTPVLERFSRSQPGEWVFTENEVLHGSGWINMPDRPLAWWRGKGHLVAVLVLDPRAAAEVVEQDLHSSPARLTDAAGFLRWTGPSGKEWRVMGATPDQAKPDEILRHVSRFGDWTLHHHYPVRVVTHYRVPVLAGSFAIAALLLEVRENFAPLFERKSIVCHYEELHAGEVALDRDGFSQILSNLLSNVEKYAGEGAKAVVRLAEDTGHFVVEVEDDGPGIPAEARKRVFLPFERAGSRVNEGASGTGLGLAIRRELAERMGGRLELVPVVAGAKFRLVIPLVERRSS